MPMRHSSLAGPDDNVSDVPIAKLPEDVLLEIFYAVVTTGDGPGINIPRRQNSKGPDAIWRLGLVSKFWRHCTLSDVRLWATINIGYNNLPFLDESMLQSLELVLSRAKAAPLTLTVNLWTKQEPKFQALAITLLITRLLYCSEQWSSVWISLPDVFWSCLEGTPQRFPILTDLRIATNLRDVHIDNLGTRCVFGVLPAVRHLAVPYHFLPKEVSTTLKDLEIRDIRIPKQFFSLFSRLQYLDKFACSFYFIPRRRYDNIVVPNITSNLKEFQVRIPVDSRHNGEGAKYLVKCLDALTMPSLQTLVIHSPIHSPPGLVDSVTNFLGRSLSPLSVLDLVITGGPSTGDGRPGVSPVNLLPILRQVPTVTKLALRPCTPEVIDALIWKNNPGHPNLLPCLEEIQVSLASFKSEEGQVQVLKFLRSRLNPNERLDFLSFPDTLGAAALKSAKFSSCRGRSFEFYQALDGLNHSQADFRVDYSP